MKAEEIEHKKQDLVRIRRAKELAGYFDGLDNIMAEGKAAKSERDTAEAERNRYAKEKEQLLAFETKLEGQRTEMERAKTTITQLQGWEPKAKEYGAARRNVERYTQKYKEAEAELARLQETEKKCRGAAEAAREAAEDVRRRYIFGQAAILASQLEEGAPCPVCGSVHHPHPAVSKENCRRKPN